MNTNSPRRGFIALAVTLLGLLALSPGARAEAVGPPETLAGVEPTGACCRIDGICNDNVTSSDCALIGGAWGGAGSTCLSNICGPNGACCVNGFCDLGESQRYCEVAAGGRWFPTCGDPNCNPVGACCIAGKCSEQTENLCFLNGGVFLGSGVACGPDTCPGACCLPNFGGCVLNTEAECNILEGQFQGVGSTCNGFYCSSACCLPDGFCQELSDYDCFISGGTILGGPCKNVVCALPTGACCLLNGTCQDNFEGGLCIEFNGAYGGNGSTCAQITCSDAGSCCFEFAPGSFFCQRNTFEDGCLNQGGTFNGAGSTCSPNPCGVVAPTGACCVGFSNCLIVSAQSCASQNGVYKGDNTVCSLVACCPADFNDDSAVNTPDLTYFLGRFGGTFNPPGSERADLNADGAVNTLDLTRFLSAFGRQCPY